MTGHCEIPGCGQLGPYRDHCHAHGTGRGFLCGSCNARVGYVDRSPFYRLTRMPEFRDYWQRCGQCKQQAESWPPVEATTGASAEPLRRPSWTARVNVTLTPEMKHALDAARFGHDGDGIEVTARIRAMIILWQAGGKHRAAVDKLAKDLR